MNLSINEGLWARHCATIQQVLILKISFGPKTLLGLARNGPLQQEPIINKGPFSGKLIPWEVPL